MPVIPWATFLMLALLGTACGFAFLLVAHPQAPALRQAPSPLHRLCHLQWPCLDAASGRHHRMEAAPAWLSGQQEV